MKSISAIVLAVFFLFTTMQETSLYLLYKLNEKSITEKYCINKTIKNSCCKGSCHFTKTIQKAEQENRTNPLSEIVLKIKEVEIYFQPFSPKIEAIILSEVLINLYRTNDRYNLLKGISPTLIKPPTFLG